MVAVTSRAWVLRWAAVSIGGLGLICIATPSEAGTMLTTPALRQAAVTSCTGDVLRLCPTVIFDEERIFACMKANRASLTPSCGAVFDQGARTVRR